MLLEPQRRAFLVQKCEEIAWGCQKDPKIQKKAIQNRCKKIYRKKIPNVYQKPSKMMPKRIPTSLICHTFAKKAEMLQTVCFPIESVVLGIQLGKSTSKMNAKSMFEKGMQKVMNMILKRDQNRGPNPMKIHLKIEVDKMTTRNR